MEMIDMVKNPKHYMLMGQETITIIAASMTLDEWRGYCRGNAIKYRLRLGKKDAVEQDLGKAMFYEELYEMHKHLCRS
jgi:hypothetical protein